MKIKNHSPKYNRVDYLVEFDQNDEGKTDAQILNAIENNGDYNGPKTAIFGGKIFRYSKDHAIITIYSN